MNDIELKQKFRQMVDQLDGQKAMNSIVGSICEYYAIEFAKLINSSETPDSSKPKKL